MRFDIDSKTKTAVLHGDDGVTRTTHPMNPMPDVENPHFDSFMAELGKLFDEYFPSSGRNSKTKTEIIKEKGPQ